MASQHLDARDRSSLNDIRVFRPRVRELSRLAARGGYARAAGGTLRSWISLAILLAAIQGLSGPASGQQLPITAPHGSRGFSGFRAGDPLVLFSLKDRSLSVVRAPGSRWLEAKTEVRLVLPPAVMLRDEGAINAAIELVVARNPALSAVLARAAPRTPADSHLPPVAGELYLRLHKPASAGGHRVDIPPDAFAASPMRTVSYPQFQPRTER